MFNPIIECRQLHSLSTNFVGPDFTRILLINHEGYNIVGRNE